MSEIRCTHTHEVASSDHSTASSAGFAVDVHSMLLTLCFSDDLQSFLYAVQGWRCKVNSDKMMLCDSIFLPLLLT